MEENQLTIFGDPINEKPSECCYCCQHFAEFEKPRTYTNRDGDFTVFGMCFKSFCKNGSYSSYPIYIPEGKCKQFIKVRRKNAVPR